MFFDGSFGRFPFLRFATTGKYADGEESYSQCKAFDCAEDMREVRFGGGETGKGRVPWSVV